MIPSGLLPPGYTGYIAGGWAACPSLATDMDIWVYIPGASHERLLKDRLHLIEYLSIAATDFTPELPQTLAFPGEGVDGYSNRHVVKVGFGTWVPPTKIDGPVKIHVLVTNLPPEDLVETFDISTHAVAIDGNGRIIKGLGWGPVTEPPVILKMTPTTPARMVKISERYGHPVDGGILALAEGNDTATI